MLNVNDNGNVNGVYYLLFLYVLEVQRKQTHIPNPPIALILWWSVHKHRPEIQWIYQCMLFYEAIFSGKIFVPDHKLIIKEVIDNQLS
jgi:hypothetical protein